MGTADALGTVLFDVRARRIFFVVHKDKKAGQKARRLEQAMSVFDADIFRVFLFARSLCDCGGNGRCREEAYVCR